MKKAFLTIVAFATSLLVAAQHKIKFSYDAAGNRVAREAVIPKLKVAQAKPSGNIPLNDHFGLAFSPSFSWTEGGLTAGM